MVRRDPYPGIQFNVLESWGSMATDYCNTVKDYWNENQEETWLCCANHILLHVLTHVEDLVMPNGQLASEQGGESVEYGQLTG